MLLADELVQHGCDMSGMDITPIKDRLKGAAKFLIEPEFAAAAEELSASYSGLVRAFPFCRLPFKETWIEVCQHDRPRFLSAGIHAPGFQRSPTRVGFLCSATRADLSAWRTHLFWSLKGPDIKEGRSTASIAMDVDMAFPLSNQTTLPDQAEIDRSYDQRIVRVAAPHPGWTKADDSVKLAMMNHTAQALTDFGAPVPPMWFTPPQIEKFYHALFQLARADWAGEVAYILATIGLMNTRNASDTVLVDKTEHNKKRAKQKQLPLFSHHRLRIHPKLSARVAAANKQTNGSHSAMRMHLVRGHWKVRRTGIFFWHPFARGSAEHGTVEKEYVL